MLHQAKRRELLRKNTRIQLTCYVGRTDDLASDRIMHAVVLLSVFESPQSHHRKQRRCATLTCVCGEDRMEHLRLSVQHAVEHNVARWPTSTRGIEVEAQAKALAPAVSCAVVHATPGPAYSMRELIAPGQASRDLATGNVHCPSP